MMVRKPGSALVIRTDFSDDEKWKWICEQIGRENEYGFFANVSFCNDKNYETESILKLMQTLPIGYGYDFVFVIDKKSFSGEECTVLVLGLKDNSGQVFRVLLPELWCVENNLSIANMDFSDFTHTLDASGIFRGF